MKLTKEFKSNSSVFVIWLFTISGIIGIQSTYSEWFLSLTPLNLVLYSFFIFFNAEKLTLKFFVAFSIPFVIGFITEFLGVNYGLIFGTYEYGNNLGYKIAGVPLTICINWSVLVITTGDLSKFIFKNVWLKSVFVGFCMTVLDAIIEVSAPRFDFWEFENNNVPFQNYLGWFIIGAIAYYLYQQFEVETNRKVSLHILAAITVFFSIFLLV